MQLPKEMFIAAVWLLTAACEGRVDQSQACKDYLACAAKAGMTAITTNRHFEADGSCWTSAADAATCTEQCKSADDAFKSAGLVADAGCTFLE
jgi:hypothetical protein